MKTELIGVRIPADMKEKLQQMADEDTRSLSNLILKILKDFLHNHEIEAKK